MIEEAPPRSKLLSLRVNWIWWSVKAVKSVIICHYIYSMNIMRIIKGLTLWKKKFSGTDHSTCLHHTLHKNNTYEIDIDVLPMDACYAIWDLSEFIIVGLIYSKIPRMYFFFFAFIEKPTYPSYMSLIYNICIYTVCLINRYSWVTVTHVQTDMISGNNWANV